MMGLQPGNPAVSSLGSNNSVSGDGSEGSREDIAVDYTA